MNHDLEIKKIEAAEWKGEMAHHAHLQTFGSHAPNAILDFALVVSHKNKPGGFVQCLEGSDGLVYWQYGGGFEDRRSGILIRPGFALMIDWTLQRYKKILVLIERHNVRAIRLCLKHDFNIIGIQLAGKETLVRLSMEKA